MFAGVQSKMEKQQRLNFPEYSAIEQEIDFNKHQRKQLTDVYVLRINGIWNAVIPDKHNIFIAGKEREDLPEFYEGIDQKIKSFGIKPRYRCVQNYGLEEKASEYDNEMAKLMAMKQFNEGR